MTGQKSLQCSKRASKTLTTANYALVMDSFVACLFVKLD